MTTPQPTTPPAPGEYARIGAWADFVYLRRGGITHVLPWGLRPAYPTSLCGRQPELWGSWLGTGSQDEIDQARRMPLCLRCMTLTEGRTR